MLINNNEITLKKSPFVFLKAIVVIQFMFGLFPIMITILFNFSEQYNATAFAQTISYNLLVVISSTIIQILIIAVSFLIWYVPTYLITAEQIMLKRGNIFPDLEIADLAQIEVIHVKQRWLGKRMGYGTLKINNQNEMKNITDPYRVSKMIQDIDTAVSLPAPFQNSKPIPQLISEGENQYVEFKSSLLWDYHQQIPNKSLYVPVIKNVAAFMNTRGGIVFIGVDDEGAILGLEPDFKVMKKKNEDGFENTFNLAFNQMVGAEFRQYVEVVFEPIQEKTICMVTVQPALSPVFLTHKGKETFYIKTGNSSQPLTVSQATKYIQSRFI